MAISKALDARTWSETSWKYRPSARCPFIVRRARPIRSNEGEAAIDRARRTEAAPRGDERAREEGRARRGHDETSRTQRAALRHRVPDRRRPRAEALGT